MKKVLITGYMRSGTTLLANFMNSQDDCLVYRDFLTTLFRSQGQLGIESFVSDLSERQKNVLLSELKGESWAFGDNMMDKASKDFSNVKELYDNAITLMNGEESYKVIGSKVTWVGGKLESFLDQTDAYVIYIYRDIRDVLLSAKNRFANFDLIRTLTDLKDDIETALSIDNKRLFVMKFEDLIFETDSTLKKLSGFLSTDIKVGDKARDRDMNWTDNSSFHDLDKVFDKRACNRWKKQFDSKEVMFAEILESDFIEKLGYEKSGKIYSASEKMSAFKELYGRKIKSGLKKGLKKFF